MEKTAKTHILHLIDGALRWATLRREGRAWVLADGGELTGEPLDLLDRWSNSNAHPGDAVRLYDGRQRFYHLAMALPAKAARQQSGAVALRVRQELGFGAETLAWATRARKRPDGMLDLFTVVARRDALAPLVDWGQRRQFASLWVGADVDAIRSLVLEGVLDPPAVVLNDEPQGAAVFYADAAGTVLKGTIARTGEVNGSLPAELNTGLGQTGLTRARFGRGEWDWLGRQAPRIHQIPESAAARGFADRLASPRLRIERASAVEQDAVIAGGVRDFAAKRVSPAWIGMSSAGSATPMESLVASGADRQTSELLTKIETQLPPQRRLARYLVVAIALVVLGVGTLYTVRSRARAQLADELDRLKVAEDIYRSQQATLNLVRAERENKSVLPVFQAVHEAAPQGMNIESLSIGEDGLLRIGVKTGDRNHGVAFFRALTAMPAFENVKLLEGPQERQKFVFDMTADIKNRKKPGVRR